jgi:hypothetical protein
MKGLLNLREMIKKGALPFSIAAVNRDDQKFRYAI